MISLARSFFGGLKEARSYPFGRRIGAYAIYLAAFLLFVASSVFCAIMIWDLIVIIFNGSLFDNPPAEDWDIR